ncbi:MAG: GDP-mannose 4,6-dehydratase, partial [Promethearchaeota archaeon]
LRPLHPYGISKVGQDLLSRQYFLNFNIEAVRLRFFNQTGIRKTGDACSDFAMRIAAIESGSAEPYIEVGNLDTSRDIQDIRDCVRACALALEKGTPGDVYNVCSGVPHKIRDVLNTLLGFSTKDVEVREKVTGKMRYKDELIILGDNAKIRKGLGYQPEYELDETLGDMFEYWVGYNRAADKGGYFKSYYVN